MTRARRTATAALVAVAVGVLACLVSWAAAAPAEATTYRYWTYWWGSGTGKAGSGWTFAQVGPAGHRVNDTWVLGWRFSTTSSTTGGAKPRQSSTFETLCPSLASPVDGQDRVALVIDYGTTADAPPGQAPPTTSSVRVECLTLPSSPHATGAGVLSAAGVSIRSEGGLICALDGYPRGECAPVVADPSPTPTPKPSSARPAPTATARTSPTGSASPANAAPAATTTPSAAVAPTTGAPTLTASAAAVALPSTDGSPSADETLPAVSGAPAPAAPAGSPVASALGVAAVVALAGLAFWLSRRRS